MEFTALENDKLKKTEEETNGITVSPRQVTND